jgi:quercetin dioxygenase-like cupin family protein
LRVKEETKRLKSELKWKAGTEDGITLAKYPHMRVVLVALKKDTDMREHSVKGPLSLFVVNGKVTVTADNREHQLKGQDLFTLRKSILHDVRANINSVILLTIMSI